MSDEAQAQQAYQVASERWNAFEGSRKIQVSELIFVREEKQNRWVDLAESAWAASWYAALTQIALPLTPSPLDSSFPEFAQTSYPILLLPNELRFTSCPAPHAGRLPRSVRGPKR